MTTGHYFEIIKNKYDKLYVRNIYIKYTIIIIVQLIIAEDVLFVVIYRKNINKININHSPFRY